MEYISNTILLNRIRFYAHHGVASQEQETGANFFVTLEAETDFSAAVLTDELTGTVSYADLFNSIKEEMDTPSCLLEHLAGRITKRLYNEYPSIKGMRLTITKENPPMGADCREAGIRLETRR